MTTNEKAGPPNEKHRLERHSLGAYQELTGHHPGRVAFSHLLPWFNNQWVYKHLLSGPPGASYARLQVTE